MNTIRPMRATIALLLAILCVGCTSRDEPAPAPAAGDAPANGGPPAVVVTIEANRYLAARIGGREIRVSCPVPADADPLLWEPDRDAIAALQAADLVLLNGAGLERWRDRVTLAPSRTVVLADAYRDEWLTFEGTVEHQHGPAGAHSHTGTDPHVWMDPHLAKRHAERIAEELARRFPAHAEAFRARAAEVARDLDDLDRRWRAARPADAPPLLANHPAYDYLARRYGWRVKSYDLDPESLPEGGLAIVDPPAGATHILWESEPVPAVAAAARALGLESVVLSPCEQAPPLGDWLDVMRENAAALAELPR